VGWIESGEWIDYAIEVTGDRSVEMILDIRIASPGGGGGFGMRFDGIDSIGIIGVPATGGYQQWATISRSIVLDPGRQIMRFESRDGDGFNLNWFELRSRPCPADFNGDGRVDGADLPIVLGSWGGCPGDCPPDVDGDGDVDGADLSSVLTSWGDCP